MEPIDPEWLKAFIQFLQTSMTPLLFIVAVTAAMGFGVLFTQWVSRQLREAFTTLPDTDTRKKKKEEYEAYYDARLSESSEDEFSIPYYIDSQQESELR